MKQTQSRSSRRTARIELLIIAIVGLAAFAASARFEIFERFSAWSVQHDNWQADEVATLIVAVALGAGIFAWRRWRDLSREVSRRQSAEELLRRSEASFKQIVEQAGDLIYKNDERGRFTFCNPTTSRVLKYSEAEMLRKSYLEVIRPDFRSEVDKFYRQQIISGTHETYKEIPVVARDGEELLLGTKVQLLTEAGRIVGFQTVARDITERSRAEAEIQKMHEYENLFRLARSYPARSQREKKGSA